MSQLELDLDSYLEESSTAIASEDSVMLSRRVVRAHFARNVVENTACKKGRKVIISSRDNFNFFASFSYVYLDKYFML